MYCDIQSVRNELALLGEPDRTDEEITLAIQEGSDLVDAYTGRHFRAETATERHIPIGGTVLLAHWPVREVVSVKDADGEDVDWELLNGGIGELGVHTKRAVDVEYHYNDPSDPVPQELSRCVARIAARLLAGPRPDTGSFSGGQVSLVLRENPLFTEDIRWVLLKYTHRRRFL